jgi:hypothetical protein
MDATPESSPDLSWPLLSTQKQERPPGVNPMGCLQFPAAQRVPGAPDSDCVVGASEIFETATVNNAATSPLLLFHALAGVFGYRPAACSTASRFTTLRVRRPRVLLKPDFLRQE